MWSRNKQGFARGALLSVFFAFAISSFATGTTHEVNVVQWRASLICAERARSFSVCLYELS